MVGNHGKNKGKIQINEQLRERFKEYQIADFNENARKMVVFC